MCSECAEEWNKVGGMCVPCSGFNMPMLVVYVLSSWGMALFLLHKSIKSTISREDIEDIWYKIDIGRTKQLNMEGVGQVLRLTGIFPRKPVLERMMVQKYGAESAQGSVEMADCPRPPGAVKRP